MPAWACTVEACWRAEASIRWAVARAVCAWLLSEAAVSRADFAPAAATSACLRTTVTWVTTSERWSPAASSRAARSSICAGLPEVISPSMRESVLPVM